MKCSTDIAMGEHH